MVKAWFWKLIQFPFVFEVQNGGEPQTFTLGQERPSFHRYWEFHHCLLLQSRITILHSIRGLLERVIEMVLRKVLISARVRDQKPLPDASLLQRLLLKAFLQPSALDAPISLCLSLRIRFSEYTSPEFQPRLNSCARKYCIYTDVI